MATKTLSREDFLRVRAAARTAMVLRKGEDAKQGRALGRSYLKELWRFDRYCRERLIITDRRTRELIPLRLNPLQRKIVAFEIRQRRRGEAPRYIVLKYRKPGVTTLEQALSFHLIDTMPNTECRTFGHRDKDTKTIFEMVTRFWEHQPETLRRPRLDARSKLQFRPPWDSLFLPEAAGATAALRGGTISRMHLSEAAHYPDLRELYRGLAKSVTDDAAFVIESTPNGKAGKGEAFYEFYQAAKKGQSQFTAMFFPWHKTRSNRIPLVEPDEISSTITDEEKSLKKQFQLDDSQIKWWRRERRIIVADGRSGQDIYQEHPNDDETCFIEGGSGYYDGALITRLLEQCRDPIPKSELEGEYSDDLWDDIEAGRLRIFEEPQSGEAYVIGSDTSEGVGADDCSAVGFNARTGEQAFSWNWNRIEPDEFGYRTMFNLGWTWKGPSEGIPAYLVIERQNPGLVTLSAVAKKGYPKERIHHDVDQTRPDDAGGFKRASRIGWSHDHHQLTTTIGRVLRESSPKIRDREVAHSVRSVQRNNLGTSEFTGRDLAVAAGVAVIGMDFVEKPSRFAYIGGQLVDLDTMLPVDSESEDQMRRGGVRSPEDQDGGGGGWEKG